MSGGPGILVCLLAPDGAGKSTLCAGLGAELGAPLWTVHMGLYGREQREIGVPGLRLAQRVGRQWRRYLRGRKLRRAGWVVVFDRYTYDALLPTAAPAGRVSRALRWSLGHALPAPDLAVVLDAPGEVLHARKPEHTVEHVERQRQAYRELAAQLPCPTEIVDASGEAGDVLRAVATVIERARVARA